MKFFLQAVILCTITGHKYIKPGYRFLWTIVKLAMDDCKDFNGRLQSLQWSTTLFIIVNALCFSVIGIYVYKKILIIY